MALDLYMWLAYRLRSLEGEKVISWTALKGQFGGGVNLMRNFKPLFSENLHGSERLSDSQRRDDPQWGASAPFTPTRPSATAAVASWLNYFSKTAP